MKRILSAMLALLCIFAFMLVYAQGFFDEMADGILRFHILGNSDSDYDQQIKLDVRDYVSAGLARCDADPYSGEYLGKIETLANERLRDDGAPYTAKISLTRTFIPKKKYKNITLPAGRYNAVRLILGDGAGKNWWCVAYPSLCFSEAAGGELSEEGEKILKQRLSEESFALITSDAEYRLWIVDFVGRIIG